MSCPSTTSIDTRLSTTWSTSWSFLTHQTLNLRVVRPRVLVPVGVAAVFEIIFYHVTIHAAALSDEEMRRRFALHNPELNISAIKVRLVVVKRLGGSAIWLCDRIRNLGLPDTDQLRSTQLGRRLWSRRLEHLQNPSLSSEVEATHERGDVQHAQPDLQGPCGTGAKVLSCTDVCRLWRSEALSFSLNGRGNLTFSFIEAILFHVEIAQVIGGFH